jgi:hypothetical protein
VNTNHKARQAQPKPPKVAPPSRRMNVAEVIEECILTASAAAQALEHCLPFVPEHTGNGEFARDDVDAALRQCKWFLTEMTR